jgi:hypothetical protein
MCIGVSRCGDIHACGGVDAMCSMDVYANMVGVHRCTDFNGHCSTQVQCAMTVLANFLGFARCGDNHSSCPCLRHPPNPEVTCSFDVLAGM